MSIEATIIRAVTPIVAVCVPTLYEGEAAEYCDALGMDNLGLTLDIYHHFRNGEKWDEIAKYQKYIIHTHIARRNRDRSTPSIDDEIEVKKFIDTLKSIGYGGRMSLESRIRTDFYSAARDFSTLLRYLGCR